jgi:RNA polymerase sigma-70 factor (ECF subfamily)
MSKTTRVVVVSAHSVLTNTDLSRHIELASTVFGMTMQADTTTTADHLAGLLEAVASQRDRSAFAQLFDYFAPRLKGFIRRRGVEAARAVDLAQDVMLTVWRRAGLYKRAQGSVSTWIFTIARNKHIDAIRREQRPEFDPSDPALVGEPEPAGETVVSQEQIAAELRAAIKELPPDQAEVLHKNFFEDKPHSEVAAELGLPLGTVKSRLRLALVELRQASEDFE